MAGSQTGSSSFFDILTATSLSSPPSELIHGGKRWRPVEHIPNKRRNTKQSKAWSLGQEYECTSNTSIHAWRCNLCHRDAVVVLPNRAIGPAKRHLEARHPSIWDDKEENVDDDDHVSGLVQRANISQFRYHLLRWITRRHISFTEVEDTDFQELLASLNKSVTPYLVQSGTSIRNWMEEEYLFAQSQLRQVLAASFSKIHISFDVWQSPNGLALCGIVAHFVGQQYSSQSVLIGLKRLHAAHTGEAIADVVLPVLREYGISEKLGVFVADNAESNDTAIKAMLRDLVPDVSDPSAYRSRCLGHIINLAAKAFLFGQDPETFEVIAESVDDATPRDSKTMRDAQIAWRTKGPIGRLHNIVVLIRSSAQRREAFKRVVAGDESDGLMVILDNSTRWNSTYLSLERALRVQKRLKHFCLDHRKHIGVDYLSDDDWAQLEEIFGALQVFHQATLRLQGRAGQGHHGSIWEALPTLEALLEVVEARLEEVKQQGRALSPLAVAYQNAWAKLSKYYAITDRSQSIYAAALLMHPSYRKHYFDHHWSEGDAPEWRDLMIKNVKAKWKQHYQPQPAPHQSNRLIGEGTFIDHYLRKHHAIQDRDSFDAFIEGPITFLADDDNVFAWFNSPSNPHLDLRNLAFDVLSIPAMSAEVERVFSSGRRLINDDRGRLIDQTIEMRELLKNWWNNNVVAQTR